MCFKHTIAKACLAGGGCATHNHSRLEQPCIDAARGQAVCSACWNVPDWYAEKQPKKTTGWMKNSTQGRCVGRWNIMFVFLHAFAVWSFFFFSFSTNHFGTCEKREKKKGGALLNATLFLFDNLFFDFQMKMGVLSKNNNFVCVFAPGEKWKAYFPFPFGVFCGRKPGWSCQ